MGKAIQSYHPSLGQWLALFKLFSAPADELHVLSPLPLDHGWSSATKGGIRALVIAERHPYFDPDSDLWRGIILPRLL